MEDKKKKSTSRFLHSIDKYAKKKRIKVAEEIKQIEEERLKKEEVKMIEIARSLMMSELASVKNQISSKVYDVKADSTRKIYEKKNRIEKEIFDDCESRIKKFTESDEYKIKLKKSVDSASKFLGTPMKIFVRERDFEVLNSISDISENVDISISKGIKQGGLIFQRGNMVLDDTYDTRIANQRKLFFKLFYF